MGYCRAEKNAGKRQNATRRGGAERPLPGDRGLQKMCDQAFNPPSTSSPVPEICPAAGLARKVTAEAMSSGWP